MKFSNASSIERVLGEDRAGPDTMSPPFKEVAICLKLHQIHTQALPVLGVPAYRAQTQSPPSISV